MSENYDIELEPVTYSADHIRALVRAITESDSAEYVLVLSETGPEVRTRTVARDQGYAVLCDVNALLEGDAPPLERWDEEPWLYELMARILREYEPERLADAHRRRAELEGGDG